MYASDVEKTAVQMILSKQEERTTTYLGTWSATTGEILVSKKLRDAKGQIVADYYYKLGDVAHEGQSPIPLYDDTNHYYQICPAEQDEEDDQEDDDEDDLEDIDYIMVDDTDDDDEYEEIGDINDKDDDDDDDEDDGYGDEYDYDEEDDEAEDDDETNENNNRDEKNDGTRSDDSDIDEYASCEENEANDEWTKNEHKDTTKEEDEPPEKEDTETHTKKNNTNEQESDDSKNDSTGDEPREETDNEQGTRAKPKGREKGSDNPNKMERKSPIDLQSLAKTRPKHHGEEQPPTPPGRTKRQQQDDLEYGTAQENSKYFPTNKRNTHHWEGVPTIRQNGAQRRQDCIRTKHKHLNHNTGEHPKSQHKEPQNETSQPKPTPSKHHEPKEHEIPNGNLAEAQQEITHPQLAAPPASIHTSPTYPPPPDLSASSYPEINLEEAPWLTLDALPVNTPPENHGSKEHTTPNENQPDARPIAQPNSTYTIPTHLPPPLPPKGTNHPEINLEEAPWLKQNAQNTNLDPPPTQQPT